MGLLLVGANKWESQLILSHAIYYTSRALHEYANQFCLRFTKKSDGMRKCKNQQRHVRNLVAEGARGLT
jgi:hypothetical protein